MNSIRDIIELIIGDPKNLPIVILLLPLISFVTLFLFAKYLPGKGDRIATITSGITFLLSLLLFIHTWGIEVFSVNVPWIRLTSIPTTIVLTASMKVNDLSAMMLLLVSFVSLLVHVYSLEYMKGKRNYSRYYPYLGLFTFSMMGIVLSDNLLITFMFWELVGFSSYLLIGFWYEKEAAMRAAKKAFLFNRIGDTFFIIGIIAFYVLAGSFEISELQFLAKRGSMDSQLLFIAGLGVFMGCVGKSAQFPLFAWLPDAMEGPTPVSALIHAATMVAAGIYLLVKIHVLLHPDVLQIIAFVGAITAFLGAVPALFQTDIKKVLAYSTISQLGYMVMAIGVKSFEASFFHLMTHGFFKACLFLTAGTVIHGMHHVKHDLFLKGHYRDFDSQDMRLMGGFRKVMPWTFICYMISAAALIGLPFFSGFLSKDAILDGAIKWGAEKGGIYYLIPALALITVLITATYMTRQIFLVFFGDNRLSTIYPESKEVFKSVHDPSLLMKGPLVLLALLSLSLAFSLNPFDASNGWLFKVPGHLSTGIISIILASLGIAAGYLIMQKETIEEYTGNDKKGMAGFFKNNWQFDKLFYYILVIPGFATARFSSFIDTKIIDRFIHFVAISGVVIGHIIAWFDKFIIDGTVNLSASVAGRTGGFIRSLQTGKIHGYFIFALFSIILLIVWITMA